MEEQLYNFFLLDTEGKTTKEINDNLADYPEVVDVQVCGNRLLVKRESILNRLGKSRERAAKAAKAAKSFSNAAQ